jgi:adenosine kinase
VEECGVYYSAGFFLTVCPAAMVRVAKHASENGKFFAVNLSAPFIPEFFKDPLMEVMPYANVVKPMWVFLGGGMTTCEMQSF